MANPHLIFTLAVIVTISACKQKGQVDEANAKQTGEYSVKVEYVDLTHEFSEETVYWVTAKKFDLDTVYQGHTEKGYYYSAFDFTTAEHGGPHIDAPVHFAANTQSVDQIPLTNLIGNAIKIDVSAKAFNVPDYLITAEDIQNWEQQEGIKIPDGAIVLLETGYSKHYDTVEKYLGTNKRGEDAVKELHFPGLSPQAAKWLVENRNISAIGIDTASIDYGQSEFFQSHVILLSKNIPIFENLMNLDKLPPKDFEIIALPMKIKNGSGGPLRIVALVHP